MIVCANLSSGKTAHFKGSKAFGWEANFIEHDPEAAEELWKTVENRMPDAFKSLDQCDEPIPAEEADLIRDCMALHWARSRAMRTAMQRVETRFMNQAVEEIKDSMKQLFPSGTCSDEALGLLERIVQEGPDELRDGRHFSSRVPEYFDLAKAIFRHSSLHIFDAPAGWEFALGDAPVLTTSEYIDGGLGPHQGVALGDAELILMPFGPKVAVALAASPPARSVATVEQVRCINAWQVRAAEKEVFYRKNWPAVMTVRRLIEARTERDGC